MTSRDELNLAQLEHDAHRTSINEAYKSTISAASASLRLLATINAGSIVALLGFIGSLANKGSAQTASGFIPPIVVFSIGLICSAIATMGMYCAQGCFKSAIEKVEFRYEFPYIRPAKGFRLRTGLGRVFQVIDVGLAIASLGLFVYGLSLCLPLLAAIRL
jgi:hypothetical protein